MLCVCIGLRFEEAYQGVSACGFVLSDALTAIDSEGFWGICKYQPLCVFTVSEWG